MSDLLENGADWTQWMGFELFSVLLGAYFLFPLEDIIFLFLAALFSYGFFRCTMDLI
jgi:hypothetical protein